MNHHPTLAAVVVATTSLAQPAPRFHWPMDGANGTVVQEVIAGQNGLLQGGGVWAPDVGHHGGSCRFDGVDDRVLLGPCDMTTGTGEFSLSMWVRPDFVTGMDRTLLAKTIGPTAQDHIWSMTFVAANALRFRLRTGPTTTELTTAPSSVFGGAWYHIVGSYDGALMRIYLNGALMAETAVAGAMGYHPQAPASMAALSTGAAPFSGWIDDVRLFDHGLSQSDVIDLLLEQLSTGIQRTPSPTLSDGRLLLPADQWRTGRVMDATGRTLRELGPVELSGPIELRSWSPGYYLVCLQAVGHQRTWPIVVQ
ncbi:MAG TPA: LamG domain-containing protein [Flavobacteriales bacterium]|nr:LamG domain-containing protein [Flavobacteriales bacterium]HNU56432.1 LamG domain-containing protein [Flavobacteriales bacterium]